MTLMVFWHFNKFEKHTRNSQIAKISADLVSAGPIYPKHFKNKKSETNNVSAKTRNVDQDYIVFVVFVILDWSNLLNLTIRNGQLDLQKSESAKKLKSDHLFFFFSYFLSFWNEKNWVADDQE